MIERVIKCDGCGKVKGPANKWLIGMQATDPNAPRWGYSIGRWDHNIQFSSQHFCGMECALKRLNEHLEAK